MIKIKLEKVFLNSGRFYKVVDTKVLPRKRLPKEYFDGKPYCYKRNNGMTVVYDDDSKVENCRTIYIGLLYHPDFIEHFVDKVRQSGIRLYNINNIRKWSGEEVIKI